MEFVKLEDCCEILDSKRIPVTANKRRNGKYPYYGANGLQDYVDDYIFDDELVLLAEDGGNFNSKDKPIAYRVSGKCWVNNHAHVLKPKQGISVDYLCYALMYYDVSGLVNGATRRKLTQATMRKMKIPILSEIDQLRIVEIMNSIQELKNDYRSILHKLDVLIKARFIEMFGDPQINQFNWNMVNISKIIKGKVSNGYFAKRDEYCEDGNVKVLGVANIVNRMYSNVKDLPRTNANKKDISKFKVQYGDMLFCRSSLVAEGIGKASIIPKDVADDILFECHVIRLPLDLNQCVPEFIQVLSTTEYFRNQVIAQSKTATMTTIGQDGILKTNIILPPIYKQKEFELFVRQVDKSRFDIKKSIIELEREVVYD